MDDYIEYLLNAAFGCFEKFATGGVDETCGAVRILMTELNYGDEVALPLSSVEVLHGRLHESLRGCRATLRGRLLDLSRALKQLLSRGSNAWACVIAVLNPDSCEWIFPTASASVEQS